ncbi:MAG: hypothetical protein AAF675_05015 [Pseudomonadota bacterium]
MSTADQDPRTPPPHRPLGLTRQIEALAWFSSALTLIAFGAILSSIAVLPVVDAPNHAARLHIMANVETFRALDWYDVVWRIQPNIALEALYLALGAPDVYLYIKAWVGLSFALFLTGALALRYELYGRLSVLTPLIPILFFTAAVRFGFLNFLLGSALILWATWGQLRLQHRRIGPKIVFGSVAGTLLFFAHPFALAIWGVVIGGLSLGSWRRAASVGTNLQAIGRALTINLCEVLLPLLLFAIYVLNGSGGSEIFYASVIERLSGIARITDLYDRSVGIAFCLMAASMIFLFSMRANKSDGRTLIHPDVILPAVLLLVLAQVIPDQIGDSGELSWRLYPTMLALLLIGMRDDFLGPAAARAVLLGSMAVMAWKLTSLSTVWAEASRRHQLVIEVLRFVPENARVTGFLPHEPFAEMSHPWSLQHSLAYATVERDAFVPNLFAFSVQQPLSYLPPQGRLRKDMSCFEDWEFEKVDWADTRRFFDHVLVVSSIEMADDWAEQVVPQGFAPVVETRTASLYAVTPPRPSPKPLTALPPEGAALEACRQNLRFPDALLSNFDVETLRRLGQSTEARRARSEARDGPED